MIITIVGVGLLHADRRTDITKLTVAFHNFASAPKNRYMVTKLDDIIQSFANYFVSQEVSVSQGTICTRLRVTVMITT